MRQSDREFVLANRQSLYERLTRERPELSEREAITLLCEQLLGEAEAEPPIPVERVASLRGIVSVEQREQPWAGILEPRGKNFVVGVRSSDGYERQRFTICHEASHTFFPGFADERQFRCNGQRTELERRCDQAACELLLPRRFVVADLLEASFDLDTVEALAERYQASIEATALRVADLWEEPAAVLVFRKRHKPSERGHEEDCEPKLRLDYSHRQGSWPYLRRHKSVADDSIMGRAYAGEIIAESGSLGDLTGEKSGAVEIHARRYGKDGRVLALVRHTSTSTGG